MVAGVESEVVCAVVAVVVCQADSQMVSPLVSAVVIQMVRWVVTAMVAELVCAVVAEMVPAMVNWTMAEMVAETVAEMVCAMMTVTLTRWQCHACGASPSGSGRFVSLADYLSGLARAGLFTLTRAAWMVGDQPAADKPLAVLRYAF